MGELLYGASQLLMRILTMTSMGFVLNSYVSLNFAPVYHFRTLGEEICQEHHSKARWGNLEKYRKNSTVQLRLCLIKCYAKKMIRLPDGHYQLFQPHRLKDFQKLIVIWVELLWKSCRSNTNTNAPEI